VPVTPPAAAPAQPRWRQPQPLGKLYASEGRPSIPPEQLLSALLLQVFYGIRSERQL